MDASPDPAATPAPAGVIFDLDGTLVDTVETRIRAWLTVFDEEAIPTSRRAVALLIGSDGRRLARQVAADAGITIDDARAEAIDARSGEIYSGLNTSPRPLPGARALAEALDEADIPWAIGTSSRREQVGASVGALHLPHEPVIVDGTHVAHAKPHPELLLRAVDALAVTPGEAWYVGDSTFDMEAAVAAGMHAIGVTTGAVGADALREAGAAEVVDTLEALLPRVRGSRPEDR